MPAGILFTLPLPVPSLPTVNKYWSRVNVAVTFRAAVMLTTHWPVPVQVPSQPVKVEPVPALAVRVTDVPKLKSSVQSPGQAMPAGILFTLPLPFPSVLTVRRCWSRVKVAVTAIAAVIVTVQMPDPTHDPDQPLKVEPTSEMAVRVTTVPLL